MNYGLVDTGGQGINGGIAKSETAGVLIYLEVQDPAEHLRRITAAGGHVVMDVTEIPNMITLAKFADPAGNVIGLVRAKDPQQA